MILFHVAISQIYDIIIATKRVVFRHSGSNASHSLYIDWICCFTCSYREVRVMNITMLKSKIHRAVVTQAELNYVGSITVDSELLSAAGILEYELVQIVDIENGNRFDSRRTGIRRHVPEWSCCTSGTGWRSHHPHVLCIHVS